MQTISRKAFSLVELLVVIAIIGVMVALLLPAVTAVQDAANRIECANKMKQKGVALHAFHDVHGHLPPSSINPGFVSAFPVMQGQTNDPFTLPNGDIIWIPTGGSEANGSQILKDYDYYGTGVYKVRNVMGWMLLLPYLEQEQLFRQFDFNHPAGNALHNTVEEAALDGGATPGNLEVVGTYVEQFQCPADETLKVDNFTHDQKWAKNARRTNYAFCMSDGSHEPYPFKQQIPDWLNAILTGMPGLYLDIQSIPRGMFQPNSRLRLSEIADGTTNTIAVGEVRQVNKESQSRPHWGVAHWDSSTGAMRQSHMSSPTPYMHINFTIGSAADGLQHPQAFGSWHRNGANFLFGDGRVEFLKNNMSFPVFEAMGTIESQEVIPES